MRRYAYYEGAGLGTRVRNAVRSTFHLAPLERWLQHHVEGKPGSSFWNKLVPPEHTYPKGSWRTVDRYGVHLKLDISNANDHHAYFAPEQASDDLLFGLVQPEHTVIDIGGNIGIYAMQFAKLAYRGRVITFEPDPVNFARLQEHSAMNQASNVTAVRMGIGAKAATHRLYQVVPTNSGMNRMITQGEVDPDVPFTEIRVEPLDAAIAGMNVTRVDVLKMDVEGFEDEALRGAEATVRRYKPVLFVEVNDENLIDNGSSARTLIDRIRSWGYRVYRVPGREPLLPEVDLRGCVMDVLCLPDEAAR
ncbi:MAG TPA: FkbM family methyltransferase [Flavobacteriales bacterium]|jgi:FkbM family methyltransferase|nr:FkbM family methyltransferase [Flavobacteriales bacterium]